MNKGVKIAMVILVPTALLAIGYVGWKLYKKEPVFGGKKAPAAPILTEETKAVVDLINKQSSGVALTPAEQQVITLSATKAAAGRG